MSTIELRHSQVLIGGSSVHVIEAGRADGPTFLFLHGWPESWRSWKELMLLAAPLARVVALDLPGVGQSTTPVRGGSKRELAAVIHALIDNLGLGDVTLVGHDVGGMIAYPYLRQYDDVPRVVIMDTVIPGVEPWDDVLRNPYIWHFGFHALAGLPELLVQGHQDDYFDYFFDVLSVDPSNVTPEARREYVVAYGSDTALAAGFDFYRSFAQDAADNIAFSEGPSVDTPLLYVRGDGESGDIETYADGFRHAGVNNLTTAHIPDAGHFAFEEQPASVWQTIHQFANKA
jgi:pimeloyl-ACP methyl ester carboxylesterase